MFFSNRSSENYKIIHSTSQKCLQNTMKVMFYRLYLLAELSKFASLDIKIIDARHKFKVTFFVKNLLILIGSMISKNQGSNDIHETDIDGNSH